MPISKNSALRSDMTKKDLSNYQQSVISNYYRNLDTIMLGKLADLVTDIFLETDKRKKEKLWQRASQAMQKLKIPPAIIDHIMEKKNIEILAKNLKDWQNRK